MAPILASEEWAFEPIELRGGGAVAAEANVRGEASLLWVENGYLWEVLGLGGTPLETLIDLAEAL